MPKSYPPEFRRRALDRIDVGHSIRSIAHDLEVSDQTLYRWRAQERVDTGGQDRRSTVVSSELRAARREIKRLRQELTVTRRANELLKAGVAPKDGSRQ